MNLAETIRDTLSSYPPEIDADVVAKDIWNDLSRTDDLVLLLPLLRNEVARVQRDQTRELETRALATSITRVPSLNIPPAKRHDPAETIAAVRASLAGDMRALIENGVLKLGGSNIPLRDVTLDQVEEKLAKENKRLEGVHREIQVLNEYRRLLQVPGVTKLGDLL